MHLDISINDLKQDCPISDWLGHFALNGLLPTPSSCPRPASLHCTTWNPAAPCHVPFSVPTSPSQVPQPPQLQASSALWAMVVSEPGIQGPNTNFLGARARPGPWTTCWTALIYRMSIPVAIANSDSVYNVHIAWEITAECQTPRWPVSYMLPHFLLAVASFCLLNFIKSWCSFLIGKSLAICESLKNNRSKHINKVP